MIRRRSTHAEQPPLSAAVAVVALAGWGTEPAEGMGDRGGLFTLAMEPDRDDGFARLWRDHEPYLRAEAARRGITPEFCMDGCAPMFFAERVSRFTWQQRGEYDTRVALDLIEDDTNQTGSEGER